MRRFEGLGIEAEQGHILKRLVSVGDDAGRAEAGVLRHVAVTAKNGPEVDEMVLHEADAVFRNRHIEGVAGLGVGRVEPGAEDVQGAEIAALLVRDGVVGVVAVRAQSP